MSHVLNLAGLPERARCRGARPGRPGDFPSVWAVPIDSLSFGYDFTPDVQLADAHPGTHRHEPVHA
jgi:hypothetical protein